MYNLLDIYTVSFFGHRRIYNFYKLEELLEKYIKKLLNEKEYVDFLVGRDGDFDQIASSCVKRIKRDVIDCNSSLVWVMPYIKSEYQNNTENLEEYYDNIEVCEESQMAHYKAAIQIRNKSMIDRSDLIIFYVERKSGGAYQSMKYAEKQGKNIINLYDELKEEQI